MAQNQYQDHADERTHLLPSHLSKDPLTRLQQDDTDSIIDSHLSKEEQALSTSAVGERLPYNDYTTIDWLHDLVKDSYRCKAIHSAKGLRNQAYAIFDSSSGWIAVAICGFLTACVAFIVDVAEATVNDLKYGYCASNPILNREACCANDRAGSPSGEACSSFSHWTHDEWGSFGIYLGLALAFGAISGGFTMLTRYTLPVSAPGKGDTSNSLSRLQAPSMSPSGKSLYLAAGSGIPEIKTFLSGFQIPHFLDFKVLVVKAVGAVFAVATGMCLGKEGPFVHISGCVGYLVASCFPRYHTNGRKMRELVSAAVAAGLSVAFGAPIGGVLFAYEEISTYFPRKVLWRSFLCSASAAIILKALNPTGTGKLILFETHYGTSYRASHYAAFVVLGLFGGLWGGLFCKLNFKWSKWFRKHPIIKNHPVFEVSIVVLATVLLQYPNPLTRKSGDVAIKDLLVDCRDETSSTSWVCSQEQNPNWEYVGWLVMGCVVKLVLTIITFGAKVPSGIIIPAMTAGSLFGRLLGQGIVTISPGIFAMVGAGAFLAGVSRMTVSLVVIMLELTGDLEYILPHMIAILVAKWVADSLSSEGVYDLAQTVLGHPFLDPEHSMHLVQKQTPPPLVNRLIPPKKTMDEITVKVDRDNKISRPVLEKKLDQLKDRGLMDAGLVLVQNGMLQGYLAEGELEFGLSELGRLHSQDCRVRLLGQKIDESEASFARRDEEDASEAQGHVAKEDSDDLDLVAFVDRTPMSVCEMAPLEYALECFGRLGLRHLMVTEEGTGKLIGVIIKKRMLAYLESLH